MTVNVTIRLMRSINGILSETHLAFLQLTNQRPWSVKVIIQLMLSVSLCPEVITFSSFLCNKVSIDSI